MLYLLATFCVLSCLASAVVLAAFIRSAQITHCIEESGLPFIDPVTHAFRPVKINQPRRYVTPARHLTTVSD